MKNIFCLLAVMLILSILIGCGSEEIAQGFQESATNSESAMLNDAEDDGTLNYWRPYKLNYWKPYKGNIPANGGGELVSVITTGEEYTFNIFDGCYKELGIPKDKFELPRVSGWRIDLSTLDIVGETRSGEIIMAGNSQTPMLVCVANSESEKVQILLREDIAQEGIAFFDFSSFDVYYEGHLVENRAQAELFWSYHTQIRENDVESMVLDGDWEYYRLTFVHRECPALQYEINFGVCGDSICMQNLHRKIDICIPLEHIRQG